MTVTKLAAIHALCFTVPRPWSAAEFTDLLASDRCFLLTRPGAFLIGRLAGPEAEILTLAVTPSARRQGLARALVAEFATVAQSRAVEQLFLEVRADNAPAIALYQAAGYVQAGYRKDYYDQTNGQKSSALVLMRDLSTG